MGDKLVRNGDQQLRKFVKAKRNSLETMRNCIIPQQEIMEFELAVCPRAKLIKLRRTMSQVGC